MFRIYELRCVSLEDAGNILLAARSIVDDYGSISLADIYEIASIRPQYSDTLVCYKSLDDAKIMLKENKWTIVLPKIED